MALLEMVYGLPRLDFNGKMHVLLISLGIQHI